MITSIISNKHGEKHENVKQDQTCKRTENSTNFVPKK